jgi:tetratricopeptide (TPR) repeat protein
LAAAVLLPCLALGLSEAVLRLADFGHPTSFFVARQSHARSVWADNPWFGLSYFSAALARSPNPIEIPVAKPPGVYRIFLLGESAALGDPRPAYGVGRYLEVLLRERFPGAEFEVVCAAMTAINSHALLAIARECADLQGDQWIVYMGNNEFMGPFGATTVFGPAAPPLGVVRANLTLQQTRVGQALMAVARHFGRTRSEPESWGGLKMFLNQQILPEDSRRQRIYQSFQHNLEDILHQGRRARVPIILSTVACNLKDCAPFGSCPSPEAPAAAGLHFKLGQTALTLHQSDTARSELARARDLDTLPFRADSRINAIITATARRWAGEGVRLLDADQALSSLSVSGIPGEEAFHEHVHLNFEGNYALARSFAAMIEDGLPASLTNRAAAAWASPAICARALGLTDWNRQTVLQEIRRRMGDAPFATQANQVERLRRLGAQLAACAGRLQPAAAAEARLLYEEALRQRPGDHWIHRNYAEFLVGIGNLNEATLQLQAVRDLLPCHHAAYFQLGRLLARQKQFPAAREALEAALRLRPDVAEIDLELGQIASSQGKWDEALDWFAKARQAHADNARILLLSGRVFEQQGNRPEAILNLREAVRLQADSWEAREILGMELALDGRYVEAGEQFEAVVRLRPDYAEGHLNLALALGRQQRLAEAREQVGHALRLDPQNPRAQSFREKLVPR